MERIEIGLDSILYNFLGEGVQSIPVPDVSNVISYLGQVEYPKPIRPSSVDVSVTYLGTPSLSLRALLTGNPKGSVGATGFEGR